ncbi:MAG: thiamine pyrophosphate-dependent enzyme [Terriglobales bacterium]
MGRKHTDPRQRRSSQPRPKSAKRKPRQASPPDSNTPVLDAEKLKALYAMVLKCRLVGEQLRRLAGDSISAPGHEAAIVGTAMHLHAGDFVAPSRSMFLASQVQGAPLTEILAHLHRASAHSADKEPASPNAYGLPLPSLSSAAQLGAGASAALSFKLQNRPAVALALVDDDAALPGFWHQPVGFASAHRLPIVFAICTSPDAPVLRDQAHSLGLPGITVDGHDLVAVYRVAQECVRRARQGHGPCLIECKIDRGSPQAAPGISSSRDPVAVMEDYLNKRKLWSSGWKRRLVAVFDKEWRAAKKAAAARH